MRKKQIGKSWLDSTFVGPEGLLSNICICRLVHATKFSDYVDDNLIILNSESFRSRYEPDGLDNSKDEQKGNYTITSFNFCIYSYSRRHLSFI